jgi:hypothetical protein
MAKKELTLVQDLFQRVNLVMVVEVSLAFRKREIQKAP